ncbi:hypothetical protein QFZ42_003343 [Variovorax paradoxus]|uniref:hypothetical protein n=1 Tax=Variovorax paradoxus TaxID=34073 RepID=UPI0027917E88|nr:hypothetical protein [Variovorax paradoxus]MDQ0571509.1 hypothetical protein [Variovorax paradoxus]
MRKSTIAALSLAICAGSLVGCVTPGSQVRRTPSPGEILANDPTTGCMKRLSEDPYIITHLADKTGIGKSGQPTLQMLTDKSRATGEEKEALSAYSAARDQCLSLGANYRRANMPGNIVFDLESSGQRTTLLLAKLYAGELTYGEYNSARLENMQKLRGNLTASDQQNAQARAADEDRRRADAGIALQNMQNQQMLLQQQQQQQQLMLQQNRPRTTNCNRLGNQMNCTTY